MGGQGMGDRKGRSWDGQEDGARWDIHEICALNYRRTIPGIERAESHNDVCVPAPVLYFEKIHNGKKKGNFRVMRSHFTDKIEKFSYHWI